MLIEVWYQSRLLKAIGDVLNSADDTGCDGMTVVDKVAMDRLQTLFNKLKEETL